MTEVFVPILTKFPVFWLMISHTSAPQNQHDLTKGRTKIKNGLKEETERCFTFERGQGQISCNRYRPVVFSGV